MLTLSIDKSLVTMLPCIWGLLHKNDSSCMLLKMLCSWTKMCATLWIMNKTYCSNTTRGQKHFCRMQKIIWANPVCQTNLHCHYYCYTISFFPKWYCREGCVKYETCQGLMMLGLTPSVYLPDPTER